MVEEGSLNNGWKIEFNDLYSPSVSRIIWFWTTQELSTSENQGICRGRDCATEPRPVGVPAVGLDSALRIKALLYMQSTCNQIL